MKQKLYTFFVLSVLWLNAQAGGIYTYAQNASKGATKEASIQNATTQADVAQEDTTKTPADAMPDYVSALLGDEKGVIYVSENIDQLWPLASVTKLVSLMVIFDAIDNGEIALDTQVTTKPACNVGGSEIKIAPNEVFTVEELLQASIIVSANNAIMNLAEAVGGNVDDFVKRMNDKVTALGLGSDIEVHTPTGLPPRMTKKSMDMGTAEGVYKLTLAALAYPKLLEIAQISDMTIHDGKIRLRSTNRKLGISGIVGLKTGYHDDAGYNLTAISLDGGAYLVSIVLGGKNMDTRDDKILQMLDGFYGNYVVKDILSLDVPISSIAVIDGSVEEADIYPDKSLTRNLLISDRVSIKIQRQQDILAPVEPGTIVGTYQVMLNRDEISKGNLIIKKAIPEGVRRRY